LPSTCELPAAGLRLDGTIIDSATTIAECIRAAAADLGLEVPTKEQASHVIGLGLHDALRHAVPGLPAARTAESSSAIGTISARGRMRWTSFPGCVSCSNRCTARKSSVSNGPEQQRPRPSGSRRPGSACFPRSRARTNASQAAPAMLLELMDELGVPAGQALMIGDTSHDLDMARAAGMDALAVTYGAHAEEGLRPVSRAPACDRAGARPMADAPADLSFASGWPIRATGVRFEVEYFGERAPGLSPSATGEPCMHISTVARKSRWNSIGRKEYFSIWDGRDLLCSTHGATYDTASGPLRRGPCNGTPLVKLVVEERDGHGLFHGTGR